MALNEHVRWRMQADLCLPNKSVKWRSVEARQAKLAMEQADVLVHEVFGMIAGAESFTGTCTPHVLS